MISAFLEESDAINCVESILEINLQNHLIDVGDIALEPLPDSMDPDFRTERLSNAGLAGEEEGGGLLT